MDRTTARRMVRCAAGLFLLGSALTGCSFPGDTSAPRPQTHLSNAQIDTMISQIQNNPGVPQDSKAAQISQLQGLKKRMNGPQSH